VTLGHRPYGSRNLLLIAEVDGNEFEPASCLFPPVRSVSVPPAALLPPPYNQRALLREADCHALANARSGAGNEDDLSVEGRRGMKRLSVLDNVSPGLIR